MNEYAFTNDQINIMIDSESNQIVDAAKCMGLLIDEHLSWSKKNSSSNLIRVNFSPH